jgi:stearoyl-CoA desaturase (delta-9 desaturase)
LGEGWHNNHHYYAGTRQGFFWWQIDITYYILKMMSFLGLIWGLNLYLNVYDAHKTQIQNLKMNTNKIQSEKS